jgi:hypothetical protein
MIATQDWVIGIIHDYCKGRIAESANKGDEKREWKGN